MKYCKIWYTSPPKIDVLGSSQCLTQRETFISTISETGATKYEPGKSAFTCNWKFSDDILGREVMGGWRFYSRFYRSLDFELCIASYH